MKAHAGRLEHLFGDVAEISKGSGFCHIHQQSCALPMVDILISGPACTSISGERTSNSEFATCYVSGKGASGVTYTHGYRDMILKTKAKVSLYENVKKVAERILAARWGRTPKPPFRPAGYSR